MGNTSALWVVGDIHGQFTKMKRLLREAGLIGPGLEWTGGSARVWFMGDFFDRGPDGVSSLALAMRMQEEAPRDGGLVNALVGNHEVSLLGARRFPTHTAIVDQWARNGGMPDEPEKLTPDMVDWILERPAMAVVDDYLLIHADAAFYPLFGTTSEQVNANFSDALHAKQASAYEYLIDLFMEHQTFYSLRGDGPGRAAYLMELYGGKQIVHGHTPIHHMTQEPPETITGPFVYARDRCINVDGSMYSGGPGFAWQLG